MRALDQQAKYKGSTLALSRFSNGSNKGLQSIRVHSPQGSQMGVYMGPISAIYKGVMWDVQRGSILDPNGQTHIGHICIHVGLSLVTESIIF